VLWSRNHCALSIALKKSKHDWYQAI